MSTETSGEVFDRRTTIKVIAGFAVAAVLLYLFGRVIGWPEILRTFRNAKPVWIGFAFVSTLVSLVVWAKSWDVILCTVGIDVPFRKIVVTYFAATFADYATPFGKAGGGPFIAYVLAADTEANYQDSLASVVTADLLNLLPFFTFAGLGTLALLIQGEVPKQAEVLVAGLGGMAVLLPLAIYGSYRHRNFVEGLVVKVSSPIARRVDRIDAESIRNRIDEFYDLVDRIAASRRQLAYTLVFAYVGWLFFAAPLYLAGRTLGVHLSPVLVLFVVPASSIAGIVPTPGGVGGVEFALVGLLVALTALQTDLAASVALVYRVASYWFALAVGGLAAFSVIHRT
ncbi:lysylphosphatidylglycerol synthase transmembrane domain-containing protein [Halorussus sp. MSC15.2]|uniref:lysylphosphatidylglycerol synthase transmembrane domain-containing protein n=1 Tax=Halorussus sp. MSC15.2 TaxID=2283638 RepID=UPI0013D0A408|nr:lysylphosphatidylglycerol synthase transmembrane domain-containing protein [Halorussus sp. MSC15.2]NEU56485.1 flippase-like domain-containing protein [Halorussus sp. MSC15.2]